MMIRSLEAEVFTFDPTNKAISPNGINNNTCNNNNNILVFSSQEPLQPRAQKIIITNSFVIFFNIML